MIHLLREATKSPRDLARRCERPRATPENKTVRANYPGGISSQREGCLLARKTDDRNLIHVCPRIALERKREIEASGTKPVRRLRDSYFEAGVPLCVASKAGISFRFFSLLPLSLSLSSSPSLAPSCCRSLENEPNGKRYSRL